MHHDQAGWNRYTDMDTFKGLKHPVFLQAGPVTAACDYEPVIVHQ